MAKKDLDPAATERILRNLASHREDRHRSIAQLYRRARDGEKELDLPAFGLYLIERVPAELRQRAAEELERTGELPSDIMAEIEMALQEWREKPS